MRSLLIGMVGHIEKMQMRPLQLEKKYKIKSRLRTVSIQGNDTLAIK